MQKIKDWLFLTKDNEYVIAQTPNWSIIVALILWLGSMVFASQPVNNLLDMLFRLFLMYWASLEIRGGVNHFREILGTVVFAVVLAGFLNQLL